jgi:glucose uptake protein GlcU
MRYKNMKTKIEKDARYSAICLIACVVWGFGSVTWLVASCQYSNGWAIVVSFTATILFSIGAIYYFDKVKRLLDRLDD